MQCVTLFLILVDTGLKELYLPLLVTGIHCTKWWVWKHICQYQWSWDKPYSPGCNHLCPMLQFGSKHVCIEDVHIFKHCREMTLFLLWIGTYCISCVVQQTSGVKDLSSLVRYDDSSFTTIFNIAWEKMRFKGANMYTFKFIYILIPRMSLKILY